MSALARDTGLNRGNLYEALSEDGNPTLATTLAQDITVSGPAPGLHGDCGSSDGPVPRLNGRRTHPVRQDLVYLRAQTNRSHALAGRVPVSLIRPPFPHTLHLIFYCRGGHRQLDDPHRPLVLEEYEANCLEALLPVSADHHMGAVGVGVHRVGLSRVVEDQLVARSNDLGVGIMPSCGQPRLASDHPTPSELSSLKSPSSTSSSSARQLPRRSLYPPGDSLIGRRRRCVELGGQARPTPWSAPTLPPPEPSSPHHRCHRRLPRP